MNLFKKGHEFRSEINIAERLIGISAIYTVPTGDDFRSMTSLKFTILRERTVSYDSDLVALELSREKGFGENAQGAAFMRLLNERFTVGAETDTSFLVLPGIRFYGQKIDNLIRPTRGYRYADGDSGHRCLPGFHRESPSGAADWPMCCFPFPGG